MDKSNQKTIIRVGSRKSELALIQTKFVISQLKELYPEVEFEIISMTTMGDRVLDKPLPKIGEKSLFTKDLEVALLSGTVDFIVHSLKDLPTIMEIGTTIGAVLKRDDPRDALVLRDELKEFELNSLPSNSLIGTSSLRRTAQLKRKFPNLRVSDVRGNLNTRLKKLDNSSQAASDNNSKNYSGIILALAGIQRMGWEKRVSQIIDSDVMLYAVGQGALAVECRLGDDDIIEMLEPLHHYETVLQVVAERGFLTKLGGGCSAPVGIKSTVCLDKNVISLDGAVWSLDGSETLHCSSSVELADKKVIQNHIDQYRSEDGEPPKKCPYKQPRQFVGVTPGKISYLDLDAALQLGTELADSLINKGALNIMNTAKEIIHSAIK
ncbi:Porphobilinogen deaminase, dipyrromethane cofactor binding site,Porphobilinogen deaminase, C- [Cinara cedri]|uniref:hydroxymethylbilane synthase n=1 Tax=Cinara cedri TaxID=506608 RepID=A0A5E4ML12_9HEMI|nr:Porphobilinogen deaminase, dipyrromethane cofactor binding site,Porphobilinogen deaminase, C- [Cinara cedri]